MRDEEVKNTKKYVSVFKVATKPKNVLVKHPGGIPMYYGDCPNCGLQSKSIDIEPITQGKTAYQAVSFCPRCGTPIDWRGVIGREESEEVE